ncbi:hypothetical protein SLEP1_g44903 [Rubroshorea leprosula]|uniref:Uncharacterized protein n=1 Tax=Rubroshorea leprosula TaxID=152421 RepID=A0AAV5LI17_9ROSI|nr:hypothetical protein SLEP1_g44903 [Rubroshorea leprosula]
MASSRFYACLVLLLLLSFPWSETRPLTPYIEGRNLIASIQPIAAKEALNNRKVNGYNNKSLHDSKRTTPGGPDRRYP